MYRCYACIQTPSFGELISNFLSCLSYRISTDMGLPDEPREICPPAASEPPSSRAEVLPGNGTSSSATETLSHTKALPDSTTKSSGTETLSHRKARLRAKAMLKSFNVPQRRSLQGGSLTRLLKRDKTLFRRKNVFKRLKRKLHGMF